MKKKKDLALDAATVFLVSMQVLTDGAFGALTIFIHLTIHCGPNMAATDLLELPLERRTCGDRRRTKKMKTCLIDSSVTSIRLAS